MILIWVRKRNYIGACFNFLQCVSGGSDGTAEKNGRALNLTLKETETVSLMTIISGYTDVDIEASSYGTNDKKETKVNNTPCNNCSGQSHPIQL